MREKNGPDARNRSSFAESNLLDLSEAIDDSDIDPKVVLNRARRPMQCICRIKPIERSYVGRRDSKNKIWVKIVINVCAYAEDRLGGRLPHADVPRAKSLGVTVELADSSSAFARYTHGDLFFRVQPVGYAAHKWVLRDLRVVAEVWRGGSNGIADLRIAIRTANVGNDAKLR